MIQANPKNKRLYEEAKSSLHSLLRQTAIVFVIFAILLLITRGNPSSVIVAFTFLLSIAYVAYLESNRLISSRRSKPFKAKSTVSDVIPSDFDDMTPGKLNYLEDTKYSKESSQSFRQKEVISQSESQETDKKLIILRYFEDDFYIETSSMSLEGFITQRAITALRSGQALVVQPGYGSFELPSNLPEFSRFMLIVRNSENGPIVINHLDADYVEITIRGTWLASSSVSLSGIMLMSSSEEIISSLYRIWHEHQQHVILSQVGVIS